MSGPRMVPATCAIGATGGHRDRNRALRGSDRGRRRSSADIAVLQSVTFVMKGGEVVKQGGLAVVPH